MKPKTIIALVIMVGFASLLFLNFGQQVGGYMNFTQAEVTGQKAHVVGEWVKEEHFQYDRDQNLFQFYMKDEAGEVREVHYTRPKPANFEDAERLVIEGYAEGEIFVASNILVKCPSKYNDTRSIEQTSSSEL